MLGGYHLLKILGEGGMGTVYLAYDPLARRQLALKTMRPDIAMRPIARERFIREARSAAGLDHEHIVPIYQVGEDRNIPFIAMPFLQGESLETRLFRDEVLPMPWILKVAREVAEGLVVAHDQGVIHRDIKPANLFLATVSRPTNPGNSGKLPPINELLKPDETKSARVKILDFGLARPIESSENFTQPGTLIGTPGYMSPEQIDSLNIDARSDLFSLGCVLYQMATGHGPFEGPTLTSILRSTAEKEPKPIQHYNEKLPDSLCDLIHRMLAKNRDRRPSCAQEVVDTIRIIEEAWMEPPEPRRSSKRLQAVADLESPTLDLDHVPTERTRTTLVVAMLAAMVTIMATLVFVLK
jgi:serine/threonine protein kinase